MKVKLLGFDDRGKVRLSMKQVDQATGEDLSKKAPAEAPQGLICTFRNCEKTAREA